MVLLLHSKHCDGSGIGIGQHKGKKMKLDVDDSPTAIRFHPIHPRIYIGTISGAVLVYDTSTKTHVSRLDVSEHSCRGLDVIENVVVSIFSDGKARWMDTETERCTEQQVSDGGLYSICRINENSLGFGDEMGRVFVWDERAGSSVMTFDSHRDYVSGMDIDKNGVRLVSGSGDGTFCMHDLSCAQIVDRSMYFDHGIHTVMHIDNDKRILAGMENGEVLLFREDDWDEPCEKIEIGCESMARKSRRGRVIVGCSDGKIKQVSTKPLKVDGTVKEMGEVMSMLAVSGDRRLVAGISDYGRRVWITRARIREERDVFVEGLLDDG